MQDKRIWSCPVCGEDLEHKERSYACFNRHTYDVSAKGYVNLLLANQRKSKDPGDNKQMLSARRHVLEAGHFRKLSDALSLQAAEWADQLTGEQSGPFTILDAGCGEGYYLECVDTKLRQSGIEARLYGTDISRDAVAMAAGNSAEIHYAVASSRKLPVRADSVDALFQIFAPHSDSEFNRVLHSGGKLVTVIPGTHHLYGLKELLYPQPYLNDEAEHPYPSFQIISKQKIQDEIFLTDPEAIRDLIMMTPYYWRTEPAMLEKIMARSELRTQLDFVVTVYGKRQFG